ncbi:hypothetical protein ABT013_14500 [Streptomyces bacillaris]|uniref:hypothetical protein n=1 Tax=Streptomyces bacillaris TaxID=68179 RepID=UPI0033572EFD
MTGNQVVHSSADDLEGLGRVDPVATVRAAAAIAQWYGGCEGAVGQVERALAERGVGTPDVGGRHSTGEMVDALLEAPGSPKPLRDDPSAVTVRADAP